MPLLGKVVLGLAGLQVLLLIAVFAFFGDSDKNTLAHALLFASAPTVLWLVIVAKVMIEVLTENELSTVSVPVRIIVSTAIAALCYVVSSHFSNDSMGVATGLSGGEVKVLTFLVFAIVYAGLSDPAKKRAGSPKATGTAEPVRKSLDVSGKPKSR
jgi:hypothetical protein